MGFKHLSTLQVGMFLDLMMRFRLGVSVHVTFVHVQERSKILAEKFDWDQQVRWKLVPDQLRVYLMRGSFKGPR